MKPVVPGIIGPLVPSLSLNILLGLLITSCYLLQSLLLALMLVLVLGVPSSPSGTLFLALIAIIVARALLIYLRAKQTESIAAQAKSALRQRLIQPLLTPGFAPQVHHSSGKLQGILVEGVEAMEGFYSRYLPALLLALSGCTLILGVLASFDLLSGAIMTLFVIACPLADHLWMRWQRPHALGVFAAMHRFADSLIDALQGMVTLKAFNAAQRYRDRLAAQTATLRRDSMSTLRVTLMRSGITGFLSLFGIAVLLSVNAWRVVQETLDPMVLLFSLFIAREVFRPVIHLDNVFHSLWAVQEAKPAMAELAAEKAVIASTAQPVPLPSGYMLRFEQVIFHWAGQERPVLCGLDLTIEENQHVAIFGPSGSGKSTLIQLITRFIEPDSGLITLAGVPLNALSISELRSRISVVSQQVFLLYGTLAENLRLGRPDASEDDLWRVLEQAQLAAWARSLPHGLATNVGERGALLSGGQRQRLAIARALLKQAPILILDEATANLDLANERALYQALRSLAGYCTLISITHRQQVIENADHIYVLQQGKVVEQGSHHQLMAQRGYYASHLSPEEIHA
ncbi:ABC transporter ATP-binding protein/permease [Brenneria tiliae]|uniref:ATP-binding cassette domain-containing protein n=1 Tax=Brenneria tiliae TaxID=2914984 RepID=A0ABT0MQA3_9GAMM|nr:ATP-binding cassette domain-containing protein [Brenneria tiliae]MCL2892019.1 ATP-binding cassette domain-containing protein [Brenneria tiliae]